jgi:hypothetical protein
MSDLELGEMAHLMVSEVDTKILKGIKSQDLETTTLVMILQDTLLQVQKWDQDKDKG